MGEIYVTGPGSSTILSLDQATCPQVGICAVRHEHDLGRSVRLLRATRADFTANGM